MPCEKCELDSATTFDDQHGWLCNHCYHYIRNAEDQELNGINCDSTTLDDAGVEDYSDLDREQTS